MMRPRRNSRVRAAWSLAAATVGLATVATLTTVVPASASSRDVVSSPSAWVTVRRAPNSYVLGNAPGSGGWTFDSETSQSSWSYGFLYGEYGGCSWVQDTHLSQTGTSGNHYCSSDGTIFPMTSFAILKNATPDNDGYPVSTVAATTEYANVDPMGAIGARDPIREIPAGYQVQWRYVTLDAQFVLVRDPNVADGDGNWIFVPRSALPDPLPEQTQASG